MSTTLAEEQQPTEEETEDPRVESEYDSENNLLDTPRPTTENDSTSEDLTCPVCMDLLIDPARTNCDHLFCTFCLANWFHLRGIRNCPTCRAEIDHLEAMPNVAANVEQYVERHYNDEQKAERDESRRVRNESHVLQNLGQNPLDTLLHQPVNQTSQFEFELPTFDFEEEEFEIPETDRSYGSVSFSRRNNMINLYARAMFHTGGGLDTESDWPNTVERILNSNGPRPERYPTPLTEINARLDDFEIALRESQMAFRYLMDGLTALDPGGLYFDIIEQRFRSLGMFPREGRLVSTYPAQEGVDLGGATPPRRQTQRIPHHTDWYFIHYNRIRLERDLRNEWNLQRQRQNQLIDGVPQPRERLSRRAQRTQAEMLNLFQPEGVNGDRPEVDSDPLESLRDAMNRTEGPSRSRRRRRRHHRNNRNLFIPSDYSMPSTHATSVDNTFPTFDRSVFSSPFDNQGQSSPANAERSYEQYSPSQGQYSTQSPMHPGNTITTTAQNICVVHPDGSETWVDVDQSLEHDEGFQTSFMLHDNERCEHHRGGGPGPTATQRINDLSILLEDTEDDDPEEEAALVREHTYRFQYELIHHHHHGQPFPAYHHYQNGNYGGGSGL